MDPELRERSPISSLILSECGAPGPLTSLPEDFFSTLPLVKPS